MIATDIDGTMLRSDGTLSPRVKDALFAAVDAGIHVVPATGRPMVVAHDVIEALDHPEYWIFANGAITHHLGRRELVRGHWIHLARAAELVRDIRVAYPNVGIALEFEHSVAYEPGFEALVSIVPGGLAVDDVQVVLDQGIARSIDDGRLQKILAFDSKFDIQDLFDLVSSTVGDRAVASYSGLAFVELAADEVTKGRAVADLARDLGVQASEVASFGDNHNDVSMLRWAGRGFAMGNGSDVAKAAADEVIASNEEDGLALMVETLLAER